MAKQPTQQELMAAHNIARDNAANATAQAQAEGKSEPQFVGNRKIEPFEPMHPFGGNDNNRRVAERIFKENAKLRQAPAPAPLTAAEAAMADLRLADKLDALDEPELTDEELAAQDAAATAAALAAQQAAGAPPAPPAPANPPAPPPPVGPPPTWKGNA